MKRVAVDNSEIRRFYAECQEMVAHWNKARPERGGKFKATLELVNRQTDELVIRLDPEPAGLGKGARMTILQICFDHTTSTFEGKTPGLPIDNTQVVTLDDIQRTLDRFNP
jgi:hypothetical protein